MIHESTAENRNLTWRQMKAKKLCEKIILINNNLFEKYYVLKKITNNTT